MNAQEQKRQTLALGDLGPFACAVDLLFRIGTCVKYIEILVPWSFWEKHVTKKEIHFRPQSCVPIVEVQRIVQGITQLNSKFESSFCQISRTSKFGSKKMNEKSNKPHFNFIQEQLQRYYFITITHIGGKFFPKSLRVIFCLARKKLTIEYFMV